MNEHYLQLIWHQKRLPFHKLTTTTGKEIRIMDVGRWNKYSGPDFFKGTIRIDGVVLTGNIEIHVKSSDWIKHQHQWDEAYANVILHVVYEHDMEIDVGGHRLPVIELKPWIDQKHYQLVKQFSTSKQFPCSPFLQVIPPPVIWQEVTTCLWQRLKRKSTQFQTENPRSLDVYDQLFRFLAGAFGMKVNTPAFHELALGIPYKRLIQANRKQKMAICIGAAGLMDSFQNKYKDRALGEEWKFQKKRLGLTEMNKIVWKMKGNRPQGFPLARVLQFANLMDQMDWGSDFWENPSGLILNRLMEILMKPREDDSWKVQPMSKNTAEVIVLNSVVPFLFWLTVHRGEPVYATKALELLERMQPEQNEITRYWARERLIPHSAAESQGLLELYQEKCRTKQCLNCAIGRSALK